MKNDAPKKVLHVIDSFDLGGAQTFLLDLVRHHDSRRFIPEVAAMHGHGVFEMEFQKAGIVTHSLSSSKWLPFYFFNFLHLMMRGKYDILHFHLFGANLCAKPLAIAMGHRKIIVHDQCNDASRDQNPLLLAADAFFNRRASRIIAVSKSIRDYLIIREDLPESNVVMIPNGLDAEQFEKSNEAQRKEARAIFDLPEKVFVIGGVGRLVQQKNFKLFLQVAAKILKKHPELFFVIAGSGPMEGELKTMTEVLKIGDRVLFLGHVADRVRLYHAFDALFMSSDFEGTPMALLEAMASGLPVVASAVDGIAEACTNEMDSLLVPPRDLGGYVAALERMIRIPDLRERLGNNARATVLAHYEIHGLARQVERIYEEVLAE